MLGVDSDKDGIRDDVQIWIEQNYSSKPLIKLAMKQYAFASQTKFENINDKNLSIQGSYEVIKAASCLNDIQAESGMSLPARIEQYKTIDAMFNNTKERIDANAKASENFNGQTYSLFSKSEACNF